MTSRNSSHICTETQAKIQLLLDGELDRHSIASVQQSIESCPLCLQKYNQLKSLKVAVSTTVSYRNTPEDLQAKILNKIKEINSGRR
jgi:mycothiol system anti-sigma-R factor